MDFFIPMVDGTTLHFRPPTLRDIRTITKEMAADGGAPQGAEDPRQTEFTYRLLHRCAVWPGEKGAKPDLDDFLDRIEVGTMAEHSEGFAAFFAGRRTRPTSSTPAFG